MTVGFDSLFNDLADIRPNSYPPYNIEKVDDHKYKLTFAVAGFSEKSITVKQKENTLSIIGEVKYNEDKEYLHKGIAERAFTQTFKLAEYMNVTNAKLKNGLLDIDLVQELPKEKQPREIKIN